VSKELLKAVEASVDAKLLVSSLLGLLIKPALDKLVEKSKTQIDDVVLELLYSSLAPLIIEEAVKAWSKLDGE
jgi:hypothetical protein